MRYLTISLLLLSSLNPAISFAEFDEESPIPAISKKISPGLLEVYNHLDTERERLERDLTSAKDELRLIGVKLSNIVESLDSKDLKRDAECVRNEIEKALNSHGAPEVYQSELIEGIETNCLEGSIQFANKNRFAAQLMGILTFTTGYGFLMVSEIPARFTKERAQMQAAALFLTFTTAFAVYFTYKYSSRYSFLEKQAERLEGLLKKFIEIEDTIRTLDQKISRHLEMMADIREFPSDPIQ